MFPWIAYFFTGMWLGHLSWNNSRIRRNVFVSGLLIFLSFQALRWLVKQQMFDQYWSDYIMAEYFPPYLPFMMITIGFALMVIPICMFIGEKYADHKLILALQKMGQMTLSHYVIHLTLGMAILGGLTGKHYTGFLEDEMPTSPVYILAYAVGFYVLSILFSIFWSRKFRNGPLETVMRKISG
jgi:uncharacterized membrane protein YeiB